MAQARWAWWYLQAMLRARREAGRVPSDEGSVVETVILTAIFAALAIAVGAIIVAKITAKAHSINLN
ncbi:MAG: hypothetical protein M0Z93_12070 [Actinomycetota bacterium]|nr:hypothetical protein [Actinomycetota bacterium]